MKTKSKKRKVVRLMTIIITSLILVSSIDCSGNSPEEEIVKENGVTLTGDFPVIKDAAYSWWTAPLAVHHKNHKDKTYITYVDSKGYMGIASVDHDSGVTERNVLSGPHEADDHNAPCIVVLPDDRLMVFYARHNMDQSIRYRISIKPEDISSFGAEQIIQSSGRVTYVQAFLMDPGILRLFYRVSNTSWGYRSYSVSTGSWNPERIWLTAGKQYYVKFQRSETDPDVIRLAMYSHPLAAGGDHNIYYGSVDGSGYFRIVNGDITGGLDGANLPLTPTKFSTVYTVKTGESTRMFDLALSSTPTIAFASYTNANNAIYKYARWNGSSFDIRTICNAGQPIEVPAGKNCYFGGIEFVKGGGQTFYLSRESDKEWHIEKWTTRDTGVNWEKPELISKGKIKIYRPGTPINANKDLPLIFIRGNYNTYLDYLTDIVLCTDI